MIRLDKVKVAFVGGVYITSCQGKSYASSHLNQSNFTSTVSAFLYTTSRIVSMTDFTNLTT